MEWNFFIFVIRFIQQWNDLLFKADTGKISLKVTFYGLALKQNLAEENLNFVAFRKDTSGFGFNFLKFYFLIKTVGIFQYYKRSTTNTTCFHSSKAKNSLNHSPFIPKIKFFSFFLSPKLIHAKLQHINQ